MNACAVSSTSAERPSIQMEGSGSIPTTALRKSDWRVRHVSLERAREMVTRFHYSKGGSNTAVYCLAVTPAQCVFEADAIAVSWWLPPTKACGASVWPKNPQAVLSLSRLVCDPAAPKNAPSFLLGHAPKLIDQNRWPIWITFADEWQGHTGAIYRVAGWLECGRTKPERTYTINGRMVSRKAGPHTRTHAEMVALGAICEGAFSRIRFVRVRRDLRDEFEPIRLRMTGGA